MQVWLITSSEEEPKCCVVLWRPCLFVSLSVCNFVRAHNSTSLGRQQRTARRVASHPVVIVLCTKPDAECDRQATVVGRLLTALGDDRCAVAKLFFVQTSENVAEGITVCLCLKVFEFRICLSVCPSNLSHFLYNADASMIN